jgi:hypothetical protein
VVLTSKIKKCVSLTFLRTQTFLNLTLDRLLRSIEGVKSGSCISTTQSWKSVNSSKMNTSNYQRNFTELSKLRH